MTTTTEATVGDVATARPASIRVFESLGIDFCCGGGARLSDACERAGVSVADLEAKIDDAERTRDAKSDIDWSREPLPRLTAYICDKHHTFVRSELPRLESLFAKVAAKHGGAHPELRQMNELFLALAQELSVHLMKEEQILFPFIEGNVTHACFPSVRNPISVMFAEHEDAGEILGRLRELSGGHFEPPPDACGSFRALYQGLAEFELDLHQHIHLENNILFPRAIAAEQA